MDRICQLGNDLVTFSHRQHLMLTVVADRFFHYSAAFVGAIRVLYVSRDSVKTVLTDLPCVRTEICWWRSWCGQRGSSNKLTMLVTAQKRLWHSCLHRKSRIVDTTTNVAGESVIPGYLRVLCYAHVTRQRSRYLLDVWKREEPSLLKNVWCTWWTSKWCWGVDVDLDFWRYSSTWRHSSPHEKSGEIPSRFLQTDSNSAGRRSVVPLDM